MTIREQKHEEFEAVQRENEELKEVLSAVQIDLEAKTEVHLVCGHECGIILFYQSWERKSCTCTIKQTSYQCASHVHPYNL